MQGTENAGGRLLLDESDRGSGAPRWAAFSLARKLWLALCGLVIITALCGTAALSFFHRIAESVSVLSTVATPLLAESMALKNNADRMRSVLLDISEEETVGTAQLADITRLDAEGRRHTAKLRELAREIGLEKQFAVIDQLQHDFRSTLENMVQAQTGKAAANAAVVALHGKIRAASDAAEKGFAAFAPKGEATVADHRPTDNERADAGAAPRRFSDVHDLSAEAFLVGGILDLETFARSAEHFFHMIDASMAKPAALEAPSGQEEAIAPAAEAFAALRSLFLGPDGLVVKKRELFRSIGIFNARAKRLGELLASYHDVLASVETAVGDATDRSRARTASLISQGMAAVAMLVTLSVLVALGAAMFLTRGISLPLQRLTGHLKHMRAQSHLLDIADPALLRRSDELGQVTSAFNRLIRELADARRELIARSDAEIAKQVQRLEAAVGNMSQGLCMYDSEQRLIISNARYAEIYGIPPDHIRPGMPLGDVLGLRIANGGYYGDAASYVSRRLSTPRDNKPAHSIIELANGRTLQILRQPLKEGGWVSTHEDITERREIEAKIAHMAHHDVLTNLPNRALFNAKMDECMARVARGETMAVLHMDVDHFKTINDTLGHAVGDAVLRTVSERLLGCVREVDVIARLGGDEFAIIQTAIEHPSAVNALAARIVKAVGAPLTVEGHDVVIGASIGVAVAPTDGRSGEELLQNADLALYRAKADGRGTFRFFEREMDTKMRERQALELDLRNALVQNQFELFYQPLIDLKSDSIVCFEALIRWRHPVRGLVSPADFIPLAEENGLIVPIGEWCIKAACQEAIGWPSGIHVAVNVSPAQFKSPNLVPTIILALAESGLSPDRLDIEITESVLLSESVAALETLNQIKSLGVKISMDDFGTGYSSLSYLRSFPFDKIKIDRSFVRDLIGSKDCMAIVKAVTDLGASLGMETIAEGVETREQLDELRLQGCQAVQGYLISRPRPASELRSLIEERSEDAA